LSKRRAMKKMSLNLKYIAQLSFLTFGILFLITIDLVKAQKKDDFAMEQMWFIFSDWQKTTGTKVTWAPKKGQRSVVIAESKKNGLLKADLVDGKINALYFSKDEFSAWPTPEDRAIGKFIGKLLFAFESRNSGLVKDVLFEYSIELSQNGYTNQNELVEEFSKLRTVEVESINKNIVDEQTERNVVFKGGKKSYTARVQNPFGNPVGDMVSRIKQFQEELDNPESIGLESLGHEKLWKKTAENKLEYAQEQYKQFGSPRYSITQDTTGKWIVSSPKRVEEKVLLISLYPDTLDIDYEVPAEVTVTIKGLEKSEKTMNGEEFLYLWKELTKHYEIYLHQSDKVEVINPEKSMLILKSDEGFYHFVSIRHKRNGDTWERMEINMYPFIDE